MANVEIFKVKDDRFLYIDGDFWMWDTREERIDQKALASQAFGDVLVAGYGFGLVQSYLVEMILREEVKSVLTVELHREVLVKVAEEYGVLHGPCFVRDFYDHPRTNGYDCVIGDIWHEVAARYLPDYVRFREYAKTLLRPGGKILAWGGDYFEHLLSRQSPADVGDVEQLMGEAERARLEDLRYDDHIRDSEALFRLSQELRKRRLRGDTKKLGAVDAALAAIDRLNCRKEGD